MKGFSGFLLFALALLIAAPTPAAAQSLPPGSYLETCRDYRVDGGWSGNYRGTLTAKCADSRGRFKTTSISADCYGEIANQNGRLVCTGYTNNYAPRGSYLLSCYNVQSYGNTLSASCLDQNNYSRRSQINPNSCRNRDIANAGGQLTCSNTAPSGSYQQSCDSAYVSGNTLTARCRDPNNYLRRSSININSCRNRDIANVGGNLTCSGYDNGNGGNIPAGSYQQTCRDASVRGSTLTATCEDANGRDRRTSINVNNCRNRDIGNNNGNLTCTNYGGGVPSGSYQQTCRDAYVSGSTLTATCEDANGRDRRTSINVNNCRNRDIGNNNGNLTCTNYGGGVPSGSYQQTCRDAYVSGSTLTATCQDAGGRERRSSVNVNDCRGRDIGNDNGYLRCR
ncbi:CVNH domain-containing protein [Arenimonas oryziterrae]|uniref:CVNH domain-containing protein n=1 Tax=Arenimonas oryziterrae TaxID=498055 RepID=UPI0003B7196E|nr:CVNH domain-containing protein [Arenimonas oryziterrae]